MVRPLAGFPGPRRGCFLGRAGAIPWRPGGMLWHRCRRRAHAGADEPFRTFTWATPRSARPRRARMNRWTASPEVLSRETRPRGRGWTGVRLPEGELSGWCFAHQLCHRARVRPSARRPAADPFPSEDPIGLTRDEFRAVGKVRTRLAVYRQLGALPEGGVSWGWPDGPSPTPVACQSEEWLKAKMADCCCFCACRARSPDAGRTDES